MAQQGGRYMTDLGLKGFQILFIEKGTKAKPEGQLANWLNFIGGEIHIKACV